MSSLQYCSSPLVLVLWLVLVSWSWTTTQAGDVPSTPIVARLGKDAATSFYTITIKHGEHPLVVDLSGPLLWSRCPPVHRTVPCSSSVCTDVNRDLPFSRCDFMSNTDPSPSCVCTTHTYNPVIGTCNRGDVTTFTLSANATDGKNPLFPVTFRALGSCSDEARSLPADSWGVAGMSRLPQSLPTQVASIFKVVKEFALCLPRSSGSTGAAIFGGGPFQLLAAPPVELAEGIRQNQLPLLKFPGSGAYYFRITGINVNNEPVTLPPGALDVDISRGRGGAMFSTVTPYTVLRSDIYRALFNAFDDATSGIPRVPAVEPFKMCYQASALGVTRLGYAVANIDLLLDNGRTWLIPGGSSLAQVNDQTVCFAFLEMLGDWRIPGSPPVVPGEPAILFGGFQMEDHLLLFDLDKETFGFSGPLAGIRTGCHNFNFTM